MRKMWNFARKSRMLGKRVWQDAEPKTISGIFGRQFSGPKRLGGRDVKKIGIFILVKSKS